jgi:hypothetical protein
LGQSAPAGREGHRAQPSSLYDRHFAAKEKTMTPNIELPRLSGLVECAEQTIRQQGFTSLRYRKIQRHKAELAAIDEKFGKIDGNSVLDYTIFGACDFRAFLHMGKEWNVVVNDGRRNFNFPMDAHISNELGPQKLEPVETLIANGKDVPEEDAREYRRQLNWLKEARKDKDVGHIHRPRKEYHTQLVHMLTRGMTDHMAAYGPMLAASEVKYDPTISKIMIERVPHSIPGKWKYQITVGKGMYRVLFNEEKYRAIFKGKDIIPLEVTNETSHGYEGEFLYPKLKHYYAFRGVVKNGRVKQTGEMRKLDLGGRGQDK